MSEGHVHVDPSNKKVALFIAVLALVLAFAETLGKGSRRARSRATSRPRTCGRSSRRRPSPDDGAHRRRGDGSAIRAESAGRRERQIESWKKTAERYQSDPKPTKGARS